MIDSKTKVNLSPKIKKRLDLVCVDQNSLAKQLFQSFKTGRLKSKYLCKGEVIKYRYCVDI